MSTKLITPWKRSNSAFYWFRMVVPLRYRTAVGKSEIKQSLGTSDPGDARRLCAQAQAQWLDQFREIETRQQQAAAIEGVEVVDRYLDDQADLHGGLSAVMSYELQDFALSEAAMLILNDERENELGHDPSLARRSDRAISCQRSRGARSDRATPQRVAAPPPDQIAARS